VQILDMRKICAAFGGIGYVRAMIQIKNHPNHLIFYYLFSMPYVNFSGRKIVPPAKSQGDNSNFVTAG
jgi:hypothetical protein